MDALTHAETLALAVEATPPLISPPEGEKNSAEVNAQLEAAWGEGIIVRLFAPPPPGRTG